MNHSISRSIGTLARTSTTKRRTRILLPEAAAVNSNTCRLITARPFSTESDRDGPQSHQNDTVVGRSGKVYSQRTVKIVETIGRALGYTLQKSTAVTLTSDYYDRCADRFNQEKSFWVNECGLPDSFQTWFQVTQLHMWLLTVRFRAMKAPLGRYYIQEFVNHSFIDIEERMRGPENKITKGTLIKKYMKLLLDQHRGFQTIADWAISRDSPQESDQFLAALIWRNLFGAAWGSGMGGVSGIFDSSTLVPQQQQQQQQQPSPSNPTPPTLLDITPPPKVHSFDNDVKFAEILERLVTFIRKELVRLDQVPDHVITSSPSSRQSSPATDSNQIRLTQFNKI